VEVTVVDRETLLGMNPDVTPSTIGGLVIPGESICDPFWATRGHAELAVMNGAEVLLGSGVASIDRFDHGFIIHLDNGTFLETGYIVNAAGLWSDEIARMVGDESFEITPRKGEFLLTEDDIGITQIILPVPTPKSKGILVSPVIFGGFLLGPTAEDQTDKADRSTSTNGMNLITDGTEKLIPGISGKSTIRQFAGVRAVCSTGDFVIRPSDAAPRMVHAAGIRSTGLSASPGIARMVVEQLASTGLLLTLKEERIESLDDIFNTDESNPGEIVCMCRSITRQEIAGALHRPLAPCTIDGVKRRTGATLGECQGNYCLAPIMDMIRAASGNSGRPMLKGIHGSELYQPPAQEGGRL
jgi:glycerol-3-phosphate dehydrogenase